MNLDSCGVQFPVLAADLKLYRHVLQRPCRCLEISVFGGAVLAAALCQVVLGRIQSCYPICSRLDVPSLSCTITACYVCCNVLASVHVLTEIVRKHALRSRPVLQPRPHVLRGQLHEHALVPPQLCQGDLPIQAQRLCMRAEVHPTCPTAARQLLFACPHTSMRGAVSMRLPACNDPHGQRMYLSMPEVFACSMMVMAGMRMFRACNAARMRCAPGALRGALCGLQHMHDHMRACMHAGRVSAPAQLQWQR